MATTYAVQFDFDVDGDFETAGDDITAYVIMANSHIGFTGPFSHIAQLGTAVLTLDNTDGRFSPDNAGGAYFGTQWKGLPVRIQATSGSTWDIYNGVIDRIVPSAGQGGKKRVRIDCEDMLGKLSRAPVAMPLQENKNQDELYRLIGSAAFRTAFASGTVTFDENVGDGDQLTIADKTYTFCLTLDAAYEVLIGTDKEDTAINLVAAILDDPDVDDEGAQLYGTNTFRSEVVTASVSGAVVTIMAKARGAAGNAVAMSTFSPHVHMRDFLANTGAIESGAEDDTFSEDQIYMVLTEVSGTPGFEYTWLLGEDGVVTGTEQTTIHIVGRYDGNPGHNVDVDYLNAVAGWVNVGNLVSSGSDSDEAFAVLPDPFDRIRIRLKHTTAGTTSHKLYLDHVYAEISGLVEGVTLSGATLSGGVDGPAGAFSYETGARVFDVAANQWQAGSTVGYRALRDVAKSEYGYIHVSRGGILTGWDKDHEFELIAPASDITINNTHDGQSGVFGDQLFNRSTVSYTPPGKTSAQVVAKANSPVRIPGKTGGERWHEDVGYPGSTAPNELTGGSVVVQMPYVESETGNIVGAKEVITPRRGTDFTLNTESDGSGYDATTFLPTPVRLSAVITGAGIEIAFQNRTKRDGYAIGLQARGTAIISYDEQEVIRENWDSIADYGLRKFNHNMPLTSGEAYAESVAMFIVGRHKDPAYRIESITIHDANELIGAVHPQSIEIGSTITLTETQTATSGAKYYVRGIDCNIDSGGQKASLTWHIKRLDDFPVWILGIAAFSTLGYTTRPGL